MTQGIRQRRNNNNAGHCIPKDLDLDFGPPKYACNSESQTSHFQTRSFFLWWSTIAATISSFLAALVQMTQTSGVSQVSPEVERLLAYLASRTEIPFDRDNSHHEQLLGEIWTLLKPDTPLEMRITRQWGELGFQGRDPATDFRGTGELGLRTLHHFAAQYPVEARRVLNESENVYPFAIAAINVTHALLQLSKENPRVLQQLLSASTSRPQLHPTSTFDDGLLDFLSGDRTRQFGDLFSFVFVRFHDFYIAARPPNVLAFNSLCNEYFAKLNKSVRNSAFVDTLCSWTRTTI